jgi:hypothetical protein
LPCAPAEPGAGAHGFLIELEFVRLGGSPVTGLGPSALLAVVVCTLLAMPARGKAHSEQREPDALVEEASRQRISQDPVWRALVHYGPSSWRGRVESQAAAGEFFLSAQGRTDPAAELEATIRAFFAEPDPQAPDEHASCRFPARRRWLEARLGDGGSQFPAIDCPTLRTWYDGLEPAGLTLIFPEAYMNNPASMFGHTLLRVDRAGGDREHDLLAYAINFAAETGSDGGAAFAIKGIFGFYDGFFSILPYYDKLKQYGDWENRDIWEYPLALTEEEVERIVLHVWELRRVPFRYYFFDDNCSYQILALLDVARPGLALTDAFPAWVIPVDTVREVSATGLVAEKASYRASPATRLRSAVARLDARAEREALAIAQGERAAIEAKGHGAEPDEGGAILDLAYDFLRYEYLAREIARENSAGRAREILAARSTLGAPQAERAEPEAPGVGPAEGHPAALFGVGSGWEDDRAFIAMRLRPAFHSLLDPPGGYTRGAQIRILDATLRVFPENGDVQLDEAVLIDVTSLTARDRFLKPLSWTISTGLERRPYRDGQGDLDSETVWRSAGGFGLAYPVSRRALGYGLAGALVDAAPVLEEDVALGPSLELGLLGDSLSDRWGAHLWARLAEFVVGDGTTSTRVGLENRLTLTSRIALKGEVAYERSYGRDWAEARLTWQVYFQRRDLLP